MILYPISPSVQLAETQTWLYFSKVQWNPKTSFHGNTKVNILDKTKLQMTITKFRRILDFIFTQVSAVPLYLSKEAPWFYFPIRFYLHIYSEADKCAVLLQRIFTEMVASQPASQIKQFFVVQGIVLDTLQKTIFLSMRWSFLLVDFGADYLLCRRVATSRTVCLLAF